MANGELMANFWVRINNLSGYPEQLDKRLIFEVERFSDAMPGGSDTASVTVKGPALALRNLVHFLGYSLTISGDATPNAWSGIINGIDLRIGVETHQYSLDDVSNRIQVLYSYEDVDGDTVASSTDWAVDTESVDRFGYRELRHSTSGLDEAAADLLRDRLLSRLALVEPSSVEIDFGAGADAEAKIYGTGLWSTLGLRYYGNSIGREEHTDGNSEQPLGLGFESLLMGWVDIHEKMHIYDHAAQFAEFSDGDLFVIDTPEVSGTNVNGPYTAKGGPSATEVTVVSASVEDPIYFNWPDEIQGVEDSFDLGNIRMEEYCLVEGSALNNRFHLISGSRDNKLYTRESSTGEINTEDWSTTEVLTQGCVVEVEEEIGDDYGPGYLAAAASVTVYGIQIAQSFYNQSGGAFALARVGISLWKVGSPTDSVTVKLCANDGGVPGSTLATGTIAPADVRTVAGWIWADMDTAITLDDETSAYFLVIQRVGDPDPANYYRVTVDADAGYDAGSMLVHDGKSTWVASDSDLCFRAWGAVETSEQIRTIAEATGQFLSTVTVRGAGSDIEMNQYRDGASTGLDEIEAAVEIGMDDGSGMSATITHDGALVIDDLPSSATPELALSDAGLQWRLGGGPVAPGTLISGKWVSINNAPVGQGFAKTPAVLVAWSEYDVRSGTLQIRRQGAPDPFALGEVVQG